MDDPSRTTGPQPMTGARADAGVDQVAPDEAAVRDALQLVVDPEIGINIVDLGLVYGVRLNGRVAVLDMTLTSPACPLTDVIESQTYEALAGVVEDFTINWVWSPPWSPARMTDQGREEARALGLTV